MAFLGWFFLRVVFASLVTPADASQYTAGLILLAAAPCTAMVFVWSQLTDGDPAYTLAQVALNDLILLVVFAPIVMLLLGIAHVAIPATVLVTSVVVFIAVPLSAGFASRYFLIKAQGGPGPRSLPHPLVEMSAGHPWLAPGHAATSAPTRCTPKALQIAAGLGTRVASSDGSVDAQDEFCWPLSAEVILMNLSTWRSPSKPPRPDTEFGGEIAPIGYLQDNVNRLFGQFFRTWPDSAIASRDTSDLAFSPRIDVREDDKHVAVTCDLPGLSATDVEVTVSPGSLTIRGERRDESDGTEAGYHVAERSFGAFERSFALPDGMDTDRAHASFKNGCLSVAIPKTTATRKSVR